MRSRMDRYYKDEEMLQRTSRNDLLYEELYKEKQEPTSNITVLDNINEIDISKIKEIVSDRENYRKLRNYEDLVDKKEKPKKEVTPVEFEMIDESKYDINRILEKKRSDKNEDDKVRKIGNAEYNALTELSKVDFSNQDDNLKDLMDTITMKTSTVTDLFANLKETQEIEKTDTTFYTKSDSFDKEDFDESFKEEEEKSSNTALIIIIVSVILIAIAVFVWFKFFK